MRPVLMLLVIAMAAGGCKDAADGSNDSSAGTGGAQAGTTGMASGGTGSPSGTGGASPLATGGSPAKGSGGTTSGGGGAPPAAGSGGSGGGGAGGAPAMHAGSGGAAIADGGAADPGALDDYNGMCASARWSTVSEQCWSCWCGACAETLNTATRRSLEIFECMFEQKLLVNDLFELGCEVNGGQQECVGDDSADWDKLVAFDMCLMAMPTAPAFRACETECGVSYSGDVCDRYP